MKNLFLSIAVGIMVSFTATSVSAQKVYSCNSKYDADIKVYVCESKYDADLWVYKVDSQYDVNDNGLWYFCESKYDAKKKIFFADSK